MTFLKFSPNRLVVSYEISRKVIAALHTGIKPIDAEDNRVYKQILDWLFSIGISSLHPRYNLKPSGSIEEMQQGKTTKVTAKHYIFDFTYRASIFNERQKDEIKEKMRENRDLFAGVL